jgi:hypothetical protein
VHRTVKVDTQIKTRPEAGAGQRCAIQGTEIVGIHQLEDGVCVRRISAGSEQEGAGRSLDHAEGGPGYWRVPKACDFSQQTQY